MKRGLLTFFGAKSVLLNLFSEWGQNQFVGAVFPEFVPVPLIKALTTLVGRLSPSVGEKNGPERGLKTDSFSP